MTGILDYGAGNLRSVENTLDALDAPYTLLRDGDGLRQASRIILPGVGHFGQMIAALDEFQVRGVLLERLRAGVPFLGICLGLQALFEGSEEAPGARGLGLFPGMVRRFPESVRLPHMGWNQLETRPHARLFQGLPQGTYVTFMHSYYVPEMSATAAVCTYGVRYTAALESGHLFGVQFHPEKSGPAGLRMMRNFVEFAG